MQKNLPGLSKKSFSMFFGGGEIWFEHLDGIYEHTDLAIKKLENDSKLFQTSFGDITYCNKSR